MLRVKFCYMNEKEVAVPEYRSGHFGEEKIHLLLPRNQTTVLRLSGLSHSHYTDYAAMAFYQ